MCIRDRITRPLAFFISVPRDLASPSPRDIMLILHLTAMRIPAEMKITGPTQAMSVSYTHLDVYKRQGVLAIVLVRKEFKKMG